MTSKKIANLYAVIDNAFDGGELSVGTYQFAADIIQLLDPDEQDFDVVAHAQELAAMTTEELRAFRKEDLELWEEESPGTLSRRFEVGEDQIYKNLEALLASLDFTFIKSELLAMYLGLKPTPNPQGE